MNILRPYQTAIIDRIREHLLSGRRSVLCVAPTGSGKTSLAAHMIRGAISKGKKAWFLCHRSEIIRQSVETLEGSAGLNVGVIAAGFGANGYHPTQVCSIQTLSHRWQNYPLPDLLVIDECHHAVSKTWSTLLLNILTAKPSIKIVGLTATPTRLDGRGLGEWFETMVEGPPVAQLIASKWLSPYKLFAPSTASLASVHITAGDYNRTELDEAMRGSVVVGDAVREYQKYCAGKRALMFLWSIRASEQIAETLNAAGIAAAHIDGNTTDELRARAVSDFRAGRIKILCNVEICTEGFDVPACDAVFLLRPTKSLGLYLQMVGRGLRAAPGKDYVSIFDHCGMALNPELGLPDTSRVWSLEGIERGSKKKQEVPVRQCLKCYMVMLAQARSCAECGYEFPVQYREVEREEGELAEVDPAVVRMQLKREQGSAQSREQLEAIARARGYKPTWVDHILEARRQKSARSYGEQDRTVYPKRLDQVADSFRPRRKSIINDSDL